MRTSAPRGYVTKHGYRRVYGGSGRLRMEHVLVWEAHHGPVPPGHEIHHRNGRKLDNHIENLQLVTRLEHKRIHSGCVMKDGVWWKTCRKCGVSKPAPDFYEYPGRNGLMGVCKRCQIRLAGIYKQRRRERRGMELHHLMPIAPAGETPPGWKSADSEAAPRGAGVAA